MFKLTVQLFRVLSAVTCTFNELNKLITLLNDTGLLDHEEL